MTLTIEHAGQDVASTNDWHSEPALAGLCYLSGNAGAWRLLVPATAESMLPDMRTGRSATIEPGLHDPRCVDVVLDDGTTAPFWVSIDKRQIGRAVERGAYRLTVWTAAGKVLDLSCSVR